MNNNNLIAVVYFDDTQIIGRIAQVNCGQNLTALVTVRKEYSGIMESEFNDRADFSATLSAVISEMARGVDKVPAILYLGVANQFCHIQTGSSSITFERPTKIKRHHLQTLWDDTQFDTTNSEIITKQALYYKLEEHQEVLIDVLGMVTSNVEMVSCAISINNEFRHLVDANVLAQAGFAACEFISVAACELFMIPEKIRDAGCTLVRCDFFATSVANVLGDGLTQLSHYNLGSGYLVGEIMDNFGIDYETTMQLLKQCTPTFETLLEESYTANGQAIPAGIFNNFVNKRLQEFANRLNNFETARIIYLSGGNFDQVYGVRNLLANTCSRRIYACQDILTGEIAYPENTLNAMVRYVMRG